jgi:uncharacterized protein
LKHKFIEIDELFISIAKPILETKEYMKTKEIPHHDGSVFEHCLLVAHFSYKIAKRLNLDVSSIVRAALLHDFYLYKFKKPQGKNLLISAYKHAKNHPKIALENAEKHFELTKKEKNIIQSHMFPVGLPRSLEAWVITIVDKYVATIEYSTRFKTLAFSN